MISGGTCASPTTTVASYAYDGQGRRKSKTVGSTTTLFVTDADNREVIEYDGAAGAIQRWYAFGLGPDAVLNQMNVPGATRTTMIPDIQGSIVGTLDSGSGALTKIGYLPFGETPSLTSGTYRYTGRRLDPETAGSTAQPSGLYYYRGRHLSPTLGRFLQPDPIGYAGGNNLYAYVQNDPLNMLDPWGFDTQYTVSVGGTVAFIVGVGGSYSTGISVPDNPLNIGGYQVILGSIQGNAMGGGGAFLGAGLGAGKSTSNGPLPVVSGNKGYYAEGDIGYGVSVGGNVQGNSSGISGFTINPPVKVGAGYGAFIGFGGYASGTLVTPTFGQIAAGVQSLFSPPSPTSANTGGITSSSTGTIDSVSSPSVTGVSGK